MPTWELVAQDRTPAIGATLRLAERAIPVAEIRGFLASDAGGKDWKPAFAVLGVFAGLGAAFLIGVLGHDWQYRLLAAAAVFMVIGLSALHDVVWLTRVRMYRVEIITARGETLVYATTDAADAERLIAALGTVVGSQSRAA